MKKITKVAVFAAILALLWSLVLPAAAKKTEYPSPTSGFFVNDFADCITAQDEAQMQKLGEQLYAQTKAQAVVVAVESLEGEAIEDYAIGLAREWGIGDAQDDSGVLLLVSTQDREIRIEVGNGLEGRLTDGKTGRILDTYALEHLRNNDFSTGLTESYQALVEEIFAEFGVEGYTGLAQDDSDDSDALSNRVRAIAIMIAVVLWILFNLIFRKRGRRRRGVFFFGGPGSFGGGFGGGFGGSGGSSSGGFGGGGGFSGGGGGFSGGGSSRGF